MLRRLYDWTLDLAGHRHALWALFFVAVIESSFFIVPPDVLLIPMVLAARNRAWLIASVCTVGSVLGGVLGYGIGMFAFEAMGRPILEAYHALAKFEEMRVGRGARFFLVAFLLWKFGEPIKAFIERYLAQLTLAFVILLVAGFVALKILM